MGCHSALRICYLVQLPFSGRLMHHVAALGGDFSTKEREAYLHAWRYAGLILWIPESIMFHDEASCIRTFEIASICEPPPDEDGIIMANSIINSAPIVLGYKDPSKRGPLAKYIDQVSRDLIGDELADELMFPPAKRIRKLWSLRLKNRMIKRFMQFFPRSYGHYTMALFKNRLDVSDMGNYKQHSYRLPTSIQ